MSGVRKRPPHLRLVPKPKVGAAAVPSVQVSGTLVLFALFLVWASQRDRA